MSDGVRKEIVSFIVFFICFAIAFCVLRYAAGAPYWAAVGFAWVLAAMPNRRPSGTP